MLYDHEFTRNLEDPGKLLRAAPGCHAKTYRWDGLDQTVVHAGGRDADMFHGGRSNGGSSWYHSRHGCSVRGSLESDCIERQRDHALRNQHELDHVHRPFACHAGTLKHWRAVHTCSAGRQRSPSSAASAIL